MTSYAVVYPGVHTIYHQTVNFSAVLYGVADRESYGLPVGMALRQLQVR